MSHITTVWFFVLLFYHMCVWKFSMSVDFNVNTFVDDSKNMKKEREDTNTPQSVRLSKGLKPDQMIVVWASGRHDDTVKPEVAYGTESDKLVLSSVGKTAPLEVATENALRYYHRVLLQNLEPDTRFFYEVRLGNVSRGPFSFYTSPNHSEWSPEVLVFGDLGRDGGGLTLRRLRYEATRGARYSAVLHVGDFAYNMEDEGGQRGDGFLFRIEPIATRLPYMTCPGNHERRNVFLHYRTRFSMPVNDWPMEAGEMVYSFHLGPATFISYSTEDIFYGDAEQRNASLQHLDTLLQEANSAENRTLRPWLIVFGHRPMYCSNANSDDCTNGHDSLVRQEFEERFYKAGVDLILEAHEHSYERLYPVFNETVLACDYNDPPGPVHIVAGSAGCNEQNGLCAGVILKPRGPWSAARHWLPGLNGYGRLKLVSRNELRWQQVVGLNGHVIDSFVLRKSSHRPYPVRPSKTNAPCLKNWYFA